MKIKVITFDLDNTLWDVKPALLRAEKAQQEWLQKHRPGLLENPDPAVLEQRRKTLYDSHPQHSHNVSAMRKLMLTQLQLDAGYSQREAQDGAEEAFAVFLHQRQQVELYRDAMGVLAHLAERYTLGALTNGNADIYKTEAARYFDFAFLAEDVGASKPAPDMFHAAMQASEARPEEVIHVGDNAEHDVLGALGVGMYSVWVCGASDSGRAPWPHSEEPHGIIGEIGELPAVVKLIDDRVQRAAASGA